MFVYGARTGEVPEPPSVDADPKAQITIPKVSTPRPRRKMFRQLPFGAVPGIFPSCRDSNDITTQTDALSRRLCRQLPPVDTDVLERFDAYVDKWIHQNLTPIPAGGLMDFDHWLDSTSYPGTRKEELRRVYEESQGALPDRIKASKVAAFIKSESYPIGEAFKPARWICSRKDVSKVVLGPVFKTIEEAVYKDHHFVKHTPVSDRPKLVEALRAAGARYIVTDYTAYEASFDSRFMCACECKMYRYMLQNYPDLARFTADTISGDNRISTRLGVRVKLEGRRMSGDMCTSLGNGFSNLMLMGFVCEELGSTWDGLVEGDDGIFAIYGELPTAAMFAKLGFEIKLAEIRDPSLGGFCGIVAAAGQVMRDPLRFLQTFGWTLSSVDGGTKVMMGLLRAKALSALYETPACPIVSAVAARALEITLGFEPRWSLDGYHVPPPPTFIPRVGVIDPGARLLFSELYGVTVDAQIKAEEAIKTTFDLKVLEDIIPHSRNHDLVRQWFYGP